MKSILNKFAAVAVVRLGVALVCAGLVSAGFAAHLALRHIEQSCDGMIQDLGQPSQMYLWSLAREKAAPGPVPRPETAAASHSLTRNAF